MIDTATQTWQSDYERATGKSGDVTRVYGKLGRFGGLAIIVDTIEDGEEVRYSPYLNHVPFGEDTDCCECYPHEADKPEHSDQCHPCTGHEFLADEEEWISTMAGATDWGGEWEWKPYDGEVF